MDAGAFASDDVVPGADGGADDDAWERELEAEIHDIMRNEPHLLGLLTVSHNPKSRLVQSDDDACNAMLTEYLQIEEKGVVRPHEVEEWDDHLVEWKNDNVIYAFFF